MQSSHSHTAGPPSDPRSSGAGVRAPAVAAPTMGQPSSHVSPCCGDLCLPPYVNGSQLRFCAVCGSYFHPCESWPIMQPINPTLSSVGLHGMDLLTGALRHLNKTTLTPGPMYHGPAPLAAYLGLNGASTLADVLTPA